MKTIYSLLPFFCLFSSFLSIAQFEKVKDFGSDENYAEFKIKFNNKIYFDVDRQLWETDGTTLGTKEVEGIKWGYRFFHQKDSIAYFLQNGQLKSLNGNTSQVQTLLGSFNLGEGGKVFQDSYIYKNPVNSSTQEHILKSFNFTSGSHETIMTFPVDKRIVSINVLGDKICFQVGIDIWISDGTTSGTEIIFQGSDYDIEWISFDENAIINGSLIFSAESEVYGVEPWRTDGTIGGTFLLKDLAVGVYPNTGRPKNSHPGFMLSNNGLVYFTSYQNDLGGYVLYETDGTEQGTQIKKQLSEDFGFRRIDEVNIFKDKLFFLALTDKFGTEYWVSDEEVSEINLLKDIWKGGGGFRDLLFRYEKNINDNYLYFPADDGIYGKELWRTDGTTEGTVMIKDLTPRAGWSSPWVMSNIEEEFFFYAGNDLIGYSLYKVNDNTPISFPEPYSTNYDWFTSMGKPGISFSPYSNYVDEIVVDRLNNTYISGDYLSNNMSIFDDTTFVQANLNAGGYSRDFIASFDNEGKFRWGKNIGGSTAGKEKIITIDDSDNLLVSGQVYEYGGFDSLQISSNDGHFYLAKYDSDGNLYWLKQAIIGHKGEVNQIQTDGDGNIYVAGCFNNFTASFGTLNVTANSSPGFFLVKYDKNGNEIWAKNLPYPYEATDLHGEVKSVLVDRNKVFTIISQGGYNWGSSCKYSDYNVIIDCHDLDGNKKWSKDFVSDDLTFVTKAAVDKTGNICFVGRYRGEFYLDNFLLSTSCENSGSFLAKMNSNGKIISVKSFLPKDVFLYDIEFDENDNYYLSGREVWVDENYSTTYELSPFYNYSNKTFVKKYDKFDKLLEERFFTKQHSDSFDSNPQIALNQENEILLTDTYSYRFDTISNVARNISQQVLLMKFSLENESNYQFDNQLKASNIIISPNPASNTINIFSADEDFINARISLFDVGGKMIGEAQNDLVFGYRVIDIHLLPAGIYFVIIRIGDQVISKKVVKQ